MLDKITILRIKSTRMTDPSKLRNVRTELDALQETWGCLVYARADIAADEAALLAVNERLWVIEDEIRDKERAQASTRVSLNSPARCISKMTRAPRLSAASISGSGWDWSRKSPTVITAHAVGGRHGGPMVIARFRRGVYSALQ